MTQLTLEDAVRARDLGAAAADQAEGADWKAKADRAIQFLAGCGEPFSSEDVRRLAGDPEHSNAMGARFLAAAKHGLIRRAGFVQYRRPESHAHAGVSWIGA